MERCGFFDANLTGEEYDRVYLAQHFAAYFASFIANGVFAEHSNQLQVVEMATPQMQVGIERGQAWINGYWYENTDMLYIPVDVADGVLNRIDSVVLRLGFSERSMWLAVKKGTPAINPIAPEVMRTADYYELQLATISIPASSIKITQAQITDTRMNQDVCGWVTGVVKQLDTTTLFNQFETYFEEFKQLNENEFTAWFDRIKGQLSEDAAGKIQIELDKHSVHLNNLDKVSNEHEVRLDNFDKTNADFEVMKREIMAPYGYFGIEQDLDTLMGYVRAGQWDKFAIGDYFIDTRTNGQKVMWEVADKNGYLHCGDSPSSLESNNIICVPRDCLEETQKYNTSDTNAGGFAASLMPAALEKIANTFSTKLQGYMATVRRLENNKENWAWASRRISLLSVTELLGHRGWADELSGGPVCHSLALFTGGNAHAMKGSGFNKSKKARQWYWLADPSANNTTQFCSFDDFGDSDDGQASYGGGLAPLIVLT